MAKPKAPVATLPHTSVSNCSFIGIQWDKATVETVRVVAEALATNAKALASLADLFKSQNVTLGPMLSIGERPSPAK